MTKVAIMTTDTIKIARPGWDVDTSDDVGLLLSLNAKNYQIIQRGTVAITGWTGGDGVHNGIWTGNFDFFFPAQQSVPEVLIMLAKFEQRYDTAGNITSTNYWTYNGNQQYETCTTWVDTSSCSGTVQTKSKGSGVYTNGNIAYVDDVPYVDYIVFRKRMTG